MKFDRLIPKPGNETEEQAVPKQETVEQPVAENKTQELPVAPEAAAEPVCPEDIVTPVLFVSFTPSRRKTTRRIRISIEGEFTVTNIRLIRERVQRVFEHFDYADYVLHQVTAIDLSAVQLMYMLKAFCARTGKFITIDAQLGNDDRSLLLNAGLLEVLSTPKING